MKSGFFYNSTPRKDREIKGILLALSSNSIDALLELLTYLEKRKLLWWNRDLLASLWITALIRSVLLYYEAPETSNLDPATAYESISHLAVHEVHNLLSLNDIDATALCQLLDEF